jgi:hypothetical protein
MSKPTRYDLRVTGEGAGLYATDEPNTNGMQYVMAIDYEALLAERDALRESLRETLEFTKHVQECVFRDGEYSPLSIKFVDGTVAKALAALQGEQP